MIFITLLERQASATRGPSRATSKQEAMVGTFISFSE